MKVLDIRDYDDVLIVKEAILNNEEFTLGEIKPLKFKIKLDGGRFTEYDTEYIDAKVAKIILSYQKNYNKLINELERKFKLKFSEEDKILKFKLESGSLELLSELLNLKEVLDHMDSKDIMYTILAISGMWFSYLGFSKYIEKETKEIETKKETKERELEAQEKDKYLETVNNTLNTLKDVLLDKKLQDAINTPKKEVLSLLDENEKLVNNEQVFTSNDADKFEYVKPEIKDIEDVIDEKIVQMEYYNFSDKSFKIKGIAPLANSSVISPEIRMNLISNAENGNDVKLKLKIITDGVSKRMKEVYILDYIGDNI